MKNLNNILSIVGVRMRELAPEMVVSGATLRGWVKTNEQRSKTKSRKAMEHSKSEQSVAAPKSPDESRRMRGSVTEPALKEKQLQKPEDAESIVSQSTSGFESDLEFKTSASDRDSVISIFGSHSGHSVNDDVKSHQTSLKPEERILPKAKEATKVSANEDQLSEVETSQSSAEKLSLTSSQKYKEVTSESMSDVEVTLSKKMSHQGRENTESQERVTTEAQEKVTTKPQERVTTEPQEKVTTEPQKE